MPIDSEKPWTVGRLLAWTADFLKKKGSESPRLDAEVLLAHVMVCERVTLYLHFDEAVGEKDRASYRELVKKRSDGAPVAYLVGRKEFFSLPLTVSPAVLIPRPDTETLVVEALEQIKAIVSPRVVDVGTGSGCISLAIAKRHATVQVIAIDLSPDALDIARLNAKNLDLADRIDFRHGDLLSPVQGEKAFDLIVSNPPYIATAEVDQLESGVRDHEPHLALDGGDNGLRVVSRLIDEAASLIRPGGQLILEIGSVQEVPVRGLIEKAGVWELAPTIRDAANHPRVIRAVHR